METSWLLRSFFLSLSFQLASLGFVHFNKKSVSIIILPRYDCYISIISLTLAVAIEMFLLVHCAWFHFSYCIPLFVATLFGAMKLKPFSPLRISWEYSNFWVLISTQIFISFFNRLSRWTITLKLLLANSFSVNRSFHFWFTADFLPKIVWKMFQCINFRFLIWNW